MVEHFKVQPVGQIDDGAARLGKPDEVKDEACHAFLEECNPIGKVRKVGNAGKKDIVLVQAGDGPAEPPPETAQEKQARILAGVLTDKDVKPEKKLDEIKVAFQAQIGEKGMKDFETLLIQNLKGSGITLDLHHYRQHRYNMAVTVGGVLPGRTMEIPLGRPKE